MDYFVHGRTFRPDGTVCNCFTCEVPYKDAPLEWHKRGLLFTVSGYGKRIPTRVMVLFNGRWRRVYVCFFSNSGTAYLGRWVTGRGAELTVSED